MKTSIATFWMAPAEASGPVRDSVLPMRTGFCACSGGSRRRQQAAASAARQIDFILHLLLIVLCEVYIVYWTMHCQG